MSRPGEEGSGRTLNNPALWQLLIVFAAILIFARSLAFGWVFDDQMEIVLNPLTRSLTNLPLIFSSTAWAGSGMETYLYRPLTTLSYAANHQLIGPDPWGFHLVNVLLHALVSLLVFHLGRSWGLSTIAAGIAGLLFAVHPVHVEVTAAVFGRKDLLAALFVLAMVLWHGKAVRTGGWRSALPVLAFAAAVLSKEVGVVGIPLVVAQDWLLAKDRRGFFRSSRRAMLYASYLAVLALYVLARNRITGGVGIPDTYYMDNPLLAAGLASRMATAVTVIGKGLATLILPLTLSPDYSFNAIPLVESPFDWRFLSTLGAVALIALGLGLRRGRSTVILLALAWYLVALFPSSNLLVLVGTIFGERLLYLPGVAFFLTLGLLADRGIRRRPIPAAVLTVLFAAALSIQTLRYSTAWESDLTLFQWAARSVPESTKAHHKLGEEYLRTGDLGNALRSLQRALNIAPDNEFAAHTYSRVRQAIINDFLPEGPSPAPSPGAISDPDILYLLGQVSRERGQMDHARGFWEVALALNPNHAGSLGDLGAMSLMAGDTVSAFDFFLRATRENPDLASAWFGLARIHLARGNSADAVTALRAFLDAAGNRYAEQVNWARAFLAERGEMR